MNAKDIVGQLKGLGRDSYKNVLLKHGVPVVVSVTVSVLLPIVCRDAHCWSSPRVS